MTSSVQMIAVLRRFPDRCGERHADRPRQVDNLVAKFCDHCGSLPFATNVKSGKPVRVDRSGAPAQGAAA